MKRNEARLTKEVRAFTHYNRYKKGIMLLNDPIGAKVILELLPLCMHINHPDLPGYMGDKGCPSGVKTMEWPHETLQELGTYLSAHVNLRDLQDHVPRHREIESLITIGSVGSVGQTRDSDYDIWVVVDTAAVGMARRRLLECKLRLLEKWITGNYLKEVHFFLMDIHDIVANNFGMVSQEGSGSAQKNLLKEEFYRTMTLVEGRIPLWWVIPASGEGSAAEREDHYQQNAPFLKVDDFIDLGNITAVPQRELLGAALWQMHKALDDPLKSVLKMALAATYLENGSNVRLLCDLLKEQVLNSRKEEVVDPYIESFRCVEQYYQEKGDLETVDLMRRCFYLKVAPQIKERDLIKIDHQDKASIMVNVVKSWGWSLKEIKELNRFQSWGVDKYRRFGDEIHDYLKKTAVLLIRRSRAALMDATVDEDVEMEILRRRVEAFYVHKNGKVKIEKRVKKKEPAYQELYFSFSKGMWQVGSSSPGQGASEPIMSSPRIVDIIALLVYNRRFDPSTAFHMVPNSSPVVLSDIQSLAKELKGLIPSADSVGLNREALMEPSTITQIVIVGNMQMQSHLHSLEEVDILALNSWNELFCEYLKADQLKPWMQRMRDKHTRLSIWMPGESDSKQLAKSLVSLIS